MGSPPPIRITLFNPRAAISATEARITASSWLIPVLRISQSMQWSQA